MYYSNKMSILNHFGKVKASYKKYESVLPEYKGYICELEHSYFGNKLLFNYGKFECTINTIHGKLLKHKSFSENEMIIINKTMRDSVNILNCKNDRFSGINTSIYSTYCHFDISCLFTFTNLIETFSKCLEKVTEKMYSELWKTIECCPFINIIDLLILKQSDTDKHIEHLEENIKTLIDDTKLLQTKINSLESQMNLFKTKIPVAVAISKCGEKTVAEEILNE